jgi:tetratricopeptide (TPR) repeat protein
MDAFHDFLLENVVVQDFNDDITNYRKYLLGKSLIAEGYTKEGVSVLKRLKKSLKSHELTLQIRVLSLLIEASSEKEGFDLEAAIREYQGLQKKAEFQEQLTVIFALIKNELRTTNSENAKIPFGSLIKDSFENFKLEAEQVIDFQTLSQLAQMADLYGEQNRAYHEIESFFEDHISRLESSESVNNTQIVNKAQLYYSLANIELRKKDFKKSMSYIDSLNNLIVLFPERLSETFSFKTTMLLSLNLNYLGNYKDAEQILDELDVRKSNRMYPPVQLTKMMLLVQRGAFKEALGVNRELSHRDSWYEKRVGVEWLLNKKFLEVILYIELGYEDLIESKMRSLLNLHGKTLSMEQNKQVKPFIKVVKRMLNHPEEITNGKLEQKLFEIGLSNVEETDLFFLSFYAWLRSKLNRRPVNSNVLELLAHMN